jgi:hypothetical protein
MTLSSPEQPNGGESAIADDEEDTGNESDESSGSSSSDSSSSDSESETEVVELDREGNVKPKRRPFVGSIFEGKLASFIICDECKNGTSSLRLTARQH